MKLYFVILYILTCYTVFSKIHNAWDSDYDDDDDGDTDSECKPTLTTVTGRFAPNRTICHKELIFNEEFSTLNLNLWEHVHDIFGENVSLIIYTLFKMFLNVIFYSIATRISMVHK